MLIDDSESTENAILVLLYRRIINKFCICKYPAAHSRFIEGPKLV